MKNRCRRWVSKERQNKQGAMTSYICKASRYQTVASHNKENVAVGVNLARVPFIFIILSFPEQRNIETRVAYIIKTVSVVHYRRNRTSVDPS